MQNLRGKTAVCDRRCERHRPRAGTSFREAGMRVMLADIETDALAKAVEKMRGFGPDVRGVACDVSDPVAVEYAAKETYASFDNVHVVCNNAGVAGGSGIDDISLETWRWVLDVNVMGNPERHSNLLATHPFARRRRPLRQYCFHGRAEQRHGTQPYSASKFAVVNMSEGLAKQIAPLGIDVTIVCPGFAPNPYLGQRAQQTTTLW